MRIKYQASFFADLTALGATPENTVALMTQLNNNGVALLASTMHEISPPNMTPVPRLRFTSPTGDTAVFIATGRLDIVKECHFLADAEIGTLATFTEFVERCTSAIFQGRGITGSRLALVVQGMSGEVPLATLNEYFLKIFKAPNFYITNPPSEWTFRANSPMNLQFAQFNEQINSILKAERVQGRVVDAGGVWQEFDRVMSEFDINTSPLNTTLRFPPESIRIFMEAVSPMIDNLEADLAAKLA